MKWEILSEGKDIINILLKNRGVSTEKEEFLAPTSPTDLSLKSLRISKAEVEKAVKRLKQALDKNEKVIVYGDYDADGICATAILWEALYTIGLDCLPYIPDRFTEGYGLNPNSIKKLLEKHSDLALIITVDNGIVAHNALDAARELGVDVIVTDHHQKDGKELKAHCVIHTTEISGSAVSWILARELAPKHNSLDLVAIGTIADLLPLLGPNRSFVKHGLIALRETKRPGLLALFDQVSLNKTSVGNYAVGFIIAPKLNAMGRLKHGMDSLRLLCTKDFGRAQHLATILNTTNQERQGIVEEVVLHAKSQVGEISQEAILLAHESYHEGVIGLAASKLVEQYYRPAIVFSVGEEFSKASARSIKGFNIIEAIRSLENLHEGGGGHPMAAGFTIKTERLEEFMDKFRELSGEVLTDEVLQRKIRVDLELDFSALNQELYDKLVLFEPTGIGNPTPTFAARQVSISDAKTVGREARHLKMVLAQGGITFNAIAFGKGYLYPKLTPSQPIDIAYNLTENEWNGRRNLELKIKDVRIS